MENIKKRETKEKVTIDERTFIINSFNPLIGNYILIKVMTSVLPLGITKTISNEVGSEVINQGSKNVEIMSKKDFIELQTDVLCTIEEEYESGETSPVMRENGTFGIEDCSLKLIAQLLIKSLVFNFKDFFGGSPLLKKSDTI